MIGNADASNRARATPTQLSPSPSFAANAAKRSLTGQEQTLDQLTPRLLNARRRHPVGNRVIAANLFLLNQQIKTLLEGFLPLQQHFGVGAAQQKELHRRRQVENLAELQLIIEQWLGWILQ